MINRPKPDQVPPYFIYMMNFVPKEKDVIEFLEEQIEKVNSFFKTISEEKLEYRYSENKWTPKQILNHLTDMERVFSYRALCFGRNDQSPIPGVDENDFAKESQANERSIEDLLKDFTIVRKSNLILYRSFRNEVWENNGNANNQIIPLRALPFFTAGHVLHHLKIIEERYL